MRTTTEVIEAVDGRWLILVNGYQWGNDPAQFNHYLGCSTQTWPTKEAAERVARIVPTFRRHPECDNDGDYAEG